MELGIIPRTYSLALYENPGDLDYISSCQVFVYGDRGFMYSIIGKGFYKYFKNVDNLVQLFIDLNIKSLEGYVKKSHLKFLQSIYKNTNIEVTEDGEGNINNRKLYWVKLKNKKEYGGL